MREADYVSFLWTLADQTSMVEKALVAIPTEKRTTQIGLQDLRGG